MVEHCCVQKSGKVKNVDDPVIFTSSEYQEYRSNFDIQGYTRIA